MIRIYDRELINSFLSQEDILPQFFLISGNPEKYQDIYFLLGDVSLFPCVKKRDEMHCHAAVPKGVRGSAAFKDAKAAIQWVFDNTDCKKVCTKADRNKKHLHHFNGKILNRVSEDDQYIYYEVTR